MTSDQRTEGDRRSSLAEPANPNAYAGDLSVIERMQGLTEKGIAKTVARFAL